MYDDCTSNMSRDFHHQRSIKKYQASSNRYSWHQMNTFYLSVKRTGNIKASTKRGNVNFHCRHKLTRVTLQATLHQLNCNLQVTTNLLELPEWVN